MALSSEVSYWRQLDSFAWASLWLDSFFLEAPHDRHILPQNLPILLRLLTRSLISLTIIKEHSNGRFA